MKTLITTAAILAAASASASAQYLGGLDFNSSSFSTTSDVGNHSFTGTADSSIFTLNTTNYAEDNDPYTGFNITDSGWMPNSEANSLAGDSTYNTVQVKTEAAMTENALAKANGAETSGSNVGLSLETFSSGYYTIEVSSAVDDFLLKFDVIGATGYTGSMNWDYVTSSTGLGSTSYSASSTLSGTFTVASTASTQTIDVGDVNAGYLVIALTASDSLTGTATANGALLGVGFDNFTAEGTVVPEPSTYAAIAGALALAFAVYRRRRA